MIMEQNFVVKTGKETRYYFLLLCLFFVLIMASRPGSNVGLLPLMVLLIIGVALYTIMIFRWMASFAVFLDVNKQEIILNHALPFRKKKIAFKDIKEVDTQNGTVILFASTPLSTWQRIVCKKADSYTIRFDTLETCERRRLIELLYTLKQQSENETLFDHNSNRI